MVTQTRPPRKRTWNFHSRAQLQVSIDAAFLNLLRRYLVVVEDGERIS